METKDQAKVIEYMQQIEILAEDILSDRREIIELNKKRDKNREAIRRISLFFFVRVLIYYIFRWLFRNLILN
jgi:hypothetical protein